MPLAGSGCRPMTHALRFWNVDSTARKGIYSLADYLSQHTGPLDRPCQNLDDAVTYCALASAWLLARSQK
jgi:hypothetical protein